MIGQCGELAAPLSQSKSGLALLSHRCHVFTFFRASTCTISPDCPTSGCKRAGRSPDAISQGPCPLC